MRSKDLFCSQGRFCSHFCSHSFIPVAAQQNERACEAFSQALLSGGDGGELNSLAGLFKSSPVAAFAGVSSVERVIFV